MNSPTRIFFLKVKCSLHYFSVCTQYNIHIHPSSNLENQNKMLIVHDSVFRIKHLFSAYNSLCVWTICLYIEWDEVMQRHTQIPTVGENTLLKNTCGSASSEKSFEMLQVKN